jgi:Piezo non-specific cation channel, R-Ras-binding domain/Ankyrin repeats (3 copies)
MVLIEAVNIVVPTVLLIAGLIRFNFVSLGYLLFFLLYLLFPPIQQRITARYNASQPKSETLLHTSVIHVRKNSTYFGALTFYSLIVCVMHALFQVLLATGFATETAATQLFGLYELSSGSVVGHNLVPDLVMLVFSTATYVVVLRFVGTERQSDQKPSPNTHIVVGLAAIFCLGAGIIAPSLIGLAYFGLFTLYVVFWALAPNSVGNGIPRLPFLVPLLVASHVIVQYLFQLDFFKGNTSIKNAEMLGFVEPNSWSAKHMTLYAAFFCEIGLLAVLGQFENAREEAHALDVHEQERRNRLRERYEQRMKKKSRNNKHNDEKYASEPDSQASTIMYDILLDSEVRTMAGRMRQLMNRMIRYHGRKFVIAVVLVSTLTVPSYLALGLISIAIIGLLANAQQFEVLARGMVLYQALAVTVEYIGAIPFLFDETTALEMIGMSKHRPTPVVFLMMEYLPLVVVAGYCRLSLIVEDSITPYALYNAVCTGDIQFVARAVFSRRDLLHMTYDGHTLLHVAAMHGQASAMKVLLPEIDPNTQDHDGNTALHLAYMNGHDVTVQFMREQSEALVPLNPNITNNLNQLYFEAERTPGTRIVGAIHKFGQVIMLFIVTHADKLSLVMLYLVGMHRVDAMHVVYLLFFIAFFSVRALGRVAWGICTAYAGFVFMSQYAWAVFLENNNTDPHSTWSDDIGLLRASNLWRDLAIYYGAVTFVAIQYQLCSFQHSNEDVSFEIVRRQMQSGSLFQARFLNQIVHAVKCLVFDFGQLWTYIAFVVVALLTHATVARLGYLLLFILCLMIHQLSGNPEGAIRRFWPVTVVYSGVVLCAQYAFQFNGLTSAVEHAYPDGWKSDLSLRDWGLRELNSSVIVSLIPPTVVFVLCVFQMRQFHSNQRSATSASRAQARSQRAELLGNPGLYRDSISMSTDDTKNDPANRYHTIGSESDIDDFADTWMTKAFDVITLHIRRIVVVHSAKFVVLMVWITVSSINQSNVANMMYLLLAFVFLSIRSGHMLWLPVSLWASLLVLSRYAFQLPGAIRRGAGPKAHWWGYDDYHEHLYRHLCGDVIILVLSALQRYSQMHWYEAADQAFMPSSVQVAPAIQLKSARSKTSSTSANDASGSDDDIDATIAAEERESIWSQLANFARASWMRVWYFANTFYGMIGLQLALFSLLLMAFARSNMLSVIYVVVVIGLYTFRGERAVSRIWGTLITVLLLSLALQYFLSIGPSPYFDLPWNRLSRMKQRWLVVGGYPASDLNWDFVALLLCALQRPYFARQQQQSRIRELELGLDIADAHAQITKAGSIFEPVGSDAGAWYNTMWSDLHFSLMLSFDKFLLVFIFAASTSHVDLISFGFVLFALSIIFSQDMLSDRVSLSTSLQRYRRRWQNLQLFNFFAMCAVIIYQMPYIPRSDYQSPSVRVEDIIGIRDFDQPGEALAKNALSASGALHLVFIFLLANLQLLLFDSDQFVAVLHYFETNRSQALYRGEQSALLRVNRRQEAVAGVETFRQRFNEKLRSIMQRMNELSSDPRFGEPFIDEEVWPQRWSDEVGRDDGKLATLEVQDTSAPRPKRSRHRRRSDASDNGSDLSDADDADMKHADKDLNDYELTEAQQHAAQREEHLAERHRSWISKLNHWIRLALVKRIDPTLWMERVQDPVTGAWRDQSASMGRLTTLALLGRVIISNTEVLAYAAFMVALAANPSVLALFIPVIILTYALFESPRAPKGFWQLCMVYTSVIVCMKFLFQLNVFCVNSIDHSYSFGPSPYCTYEETGYTAYNQIAPDYVLGVHKAKYSFGYLFYDLLALLVVVWHRANMIYKGVWDFSEEYLGDNILQQQEKYRHVKERDSADRGGKGTMSKMLEPPIATNGQGNLFDDKHRPTPDEIVRQASVDKTGFRDSYTKRTKQFIENVGESIWPYLPRAVRDYYFSIIPRDKDHIYVIKPGRDFYSAIFISEVFSLLYILLFFDHMATTSNQGISSSFKMNAFSGEMVITLIVQIGFMVWERAAYLTRSLRWKIVLQYTSVLYWGILMTIVWPRQSQMLFGQNPYLQAFFCIKAVYLVCSGLQVRYGYPTIERTGFQAIMRKPSLTAAAVVRTYRAIPFVFELRTLMDWMVNDSALDVWAHFKLEDLYASMFLVQCDIIGRKMRKRGEPQPSWSKYVNGALIFGLLLFILIAPLLVFSSANPAQDTNNVLNTQLAVSLDGPDGQFHLMTVSSMQSLKIASGSTYNALKVRRILSNSDSPGRVQQITMAPYADQVWQITPRARTALLHSLNTSPPGSFRIHLQYEFTRNYPAEAKTLTYATDYSLTPQLQNQLAHIFNESTADGVIPLPKLTPMYLRLPATGSPIPLSPAMQNAYLELVDHSSKESYWMLSSTPSDLHGASFVTVSNPVFSNLFGLTGMSFSVLGLYSIVLITIGRLVRFLFGGLMYAIPFEDLHDSDDLVLFCEGVYISRYSRLFYTEDRLYNRLIKIFRSPNLLRFITRRRDNKKED